MSAVRPGLKGGSFKPLGEPDIARIHRTALDILEHLGIGDPLPATLELARAKGCWLNEQGRLCFPRALVEDTIASACRAFTIHGRDPAYDMTLRGTEVHYATAGEAVSVYQPETKSYRPSTLVDLYDMARLVDRLEHIHRFCQTVVATEIEDPYVHNMNIAYACLAGTRKSFSVMLGAVQRTIRGIEVTDETLSYDVIEQAVCGPGHCLGGEQTLALMENEYLYPEVSDRTSPGQWQEEGSTDIRERAEVRVQEILSAHYPVYIDPKVDEMIRERFPIVLPRDQMRADSDRW